MQLIWEDDYIMMVCTDAKTLYVYDEDDTDESELLRKITGGHNEEITIVKYDDHLSLVATGALNGEVLVWDFEMSKLEGFCLGHSADITGIEFLSPYPIMVTSSIDCTVRLWGVRPCHIDYKYCCLYVFENYSWNSSVDQLTPVQRISVSLREMKGIKKHARMKHGAVDASAYGSFNMNLLFSRIQQKLKGDLLKEQSTHWKGKN
mmetsp:Transcript_1193/g.1210  ORF Transcript_1193/g.1210 Transcript_1193/m.1210 type:complete len:205 (+) Transcript_1193:1526-2140(+)